MDAINNSVGNAVFASTWMLLSRLDKTGQRNKQVIHDYADSGYVSYITKKPLIIVYHEFEYKWLTLISVLYKG